MQEQLHSTNHLLEEEKLKLSLLDGQLRSAENMVRNGKEEISRLQREKVELIAKVSGVGFEHD